MSKLLDLLRKADQERHKRRVRKPEASTQPQEPREKRVRQRSVPESPQERRTKRVRKRKVPEPPTVESATDSPAWEVRMVSQCRYVRIKVEVKRTDVPSPAGREFLEGTATEATRSPGLLTTRRIASATLALLLRLAGSLATYACPPRSTL